MRLIYNDNNTSVLSAIDAIGDIDSISIASPFIMDNSLLNRLIDSNCKIRLIIRLCAQTDEKALDKLIASPRSQVRFYTEESFHSKIFLINNSEAIVGSSNFTNGGLFANKEVNIGVSCTDPIFCEIQSIYENYWCNAAPLTKSVLNNFVRIKSQHKAEKYDVTDFGEVLLALDAPPVDKAQRKQSVVSPEAMEKRLAIVRERLSKVVVCINTEQRYNSLIEASESVYGYKRGYGHISDVCNGTKSDYKGKLWRFEDDYLLLTAAEKREMLQELSSRHENEKTITKYMFDGQAFYKQSEMLRYIEEEYYQIHKQVLSPRIKNAKSMGLPFCTLEIAGKQMPVFFADYFQVFKGKKLVDEVAIEKTLEEIAEYFDSIGDVPIIGSTMQEVLQVSANKQFYKLDGEYYTNLTSLLENCTREISKEDLLRMVGDGLNIIFENSLSKNDISRSGKQVYYIRNEHVFKNRNGYWKMFGETLSKEDLLLELDMLI